METKQTEQLLQNVEDLCESVAMIMNNNMAIMKTLAHIDGISKRDEDDLLQCAVMNIELIRRISPVMRKAIENGEKSISKKQNARVNKVTIQIH